MNQTEINKELEVLSNKFKLEAFNHFKSKGLKVDLTTIDFAVSNGIVASENEVKGLEVDSNELPSINAVYKCWRNKQGQWVCRG